MEQFEEFERFEEDSYGHERRAASERAFMTIGVQARELTASDRLRTAALLLRGVAETIDDTEFGYSLEAEQRIRRALDELDKLVRPRADVSSNRTLLVSPQT